MTHILHQIDHAIELLDDAYPSVDRSIRETLERAQAEITRLRAEIMGKTSEARAYLAGREDPK